MCPGECKDRMGDAFAKFGRVPIVRRSRVAPSDDPAFRTRTRAPFWAAGGLVHDGRGRVVLVRIGRPGARGLWFTPGGLLETGETTDGGLRREVREEVGIELTDPVLTRIIHEALSDGQRVRHGYFAQFIARAESTEIRPGHEVVEARWFVDPPREFAFRADYETDLQKVRQAASF
jgi:ADP-ribose pyrophosphatase YjhB (NUDIX family)